MTIAELIELLQDLALESPLGDDTIVRLASQKNWPFEYSLESGHCVNMGDEGEDGEFFVYLAEGEQLGYLPDIVCQEIGW